MFLNIKCLGKNTYIKREKKFLENIIKTIK